MVDLMDNEEYSHNYVFIHNCILMGSLAIHKVNVTKKFPNLGVEFGRKARKDSTTGKTANSLIP